MAGSIGSAKADRADDWQDFQPSLWDAKHPTKKHMIVSVRAHKVDHVLYIDISVFLRFSNCVLRMFNYVMLIVMH